MKGHQITNEHGARKNWGKVKKVENKAVQDSVAEMRPSEIRDIVHGLHRAIGWISDQEQEIKDLHKEINCLRMELFYPPKEWEERRIKK